MMLLTALIALGLFVLEEFQDGSPPQFVVRGIPTRVNRLRPGMTSKETHDILGLETPWICGGVGAKFQTLDGNGRHTHEVYNVRPNRLVVGTGSVNGGPSRPMAFYRSSAIIQLWFRTDPDSGPAGRRTNAATRLDRAIFSSDGHVIAEVPRE